MAEQHTREGQQLGNYRLGRLLGRGGFAEVYLGHHLRLQRQAAIKVLHASLSAQEIEDFQREAQIIATLDHPNIVRILDFDVQRGIPFLVMDYLPNGTLRQRHNRGTCLPLSTIVPYVQHIANALQYAHDQRIIHRDVKPENMLVGRHHEVILSDFGIAAIAHSTTSMTVQASVGTIPYMAPEQIQAHARAASDQYALGIIVYEWLCGVRPFEGSYTEIFAKHLMTPPPSLRQKVPMLSAEVEQVIFTALSKEPQYRFPNIQAFATALEEASGTRQRSTERPAAEEIVPPPSSSLSPTLSAPSEPPGSLELSTSSLHTARSTVAPPMHIQPPKKVPESTAGRMLSRKTVITSLAAIGIAAIGGGVTWWALTPHALDTHYGHSATVVAITEAAVGSYAVIFEQRSGPARVAHHSLTADQYQQIFHQLTGQGYRLVDLSVYSVNNQVFYATIFEQSSGPAQVVRYGLTSDQYQQTFNQLVAQGYRPIIVDGYGVNGQAFYAAIFEQSSGPAWQARHGLTSDQYQQTFNQWTGQGYRLVNVNGYGVHGQAFYTAIFEQSGGPAWIARHGLTSDQYQQALDQYVAQGYRPILIDGYTVNGQTSYAAIFEQSSGPAQIVRYGLTSDQYQQTFDQYVAQGYRLLWISGYGT